MKFKNIFLDLDGTLTDSGEGIMNSVAYAMRKFGIEETDRKKLRTFIGPPLYESFMREYGFDQEKAMLAVEYYREYFAPKGIYENRPYDGIPELLGELKADGRKLYLATSKPEPYALEIVKHFGLYDYLDGQSYYTAPVDKKCRSMMNVVFVTGDGDLDKKFAKEAAEAGLKNLKGHRSVGGMRASIYNAMPYEGVEKLVEFMKSFALNNPKM